MPPAPMCAWTWGCTGALGAAYRICELDFSRAIHAEGFGEREPDTASAAVPQSWLSELPGNA